MPMRSARLFAPVAVAVLPLLWAAPARADGFSTAPAQAAPTSTTQTVVSSVRVGHHAGFDRLVFTFTGPLPGYSVAYQPRVTQDGSGRALALSGTAFVRIALRPTSTSVPSTQEGQAPHFPMLRQVVGAGSFESVTSYGVGLAGRSGFRVSTLTGPNRLVVDFAVATAGAPTADAVDADVDTATGTGGSAAPHPGSTTGSTESGTPGQAAGSSGAPDPADSTRAVAADDGSSRSGTSTPVFALVLGGVGLAGVGVGCYLLLRGRPA